MTPPMNEDIKRLVKLTKAQTAVLGRLAIGPYYPAGRHVVSARSLCNRGLAEYHRPHLSFSITDAGRQALASLTTKETDHG